MWTTWVVVSNFTAEVDDKADGNERSESISKLFSSRSEL
jgi:hypothetical protein